MKLPILSQNKQSVFNIVGCVVVVVINALINFFLSPFIVENLGVEANGYIMLANNFVSYVSLITVALDSMAGRFFLIEHHKGNLKEASEYYSSVWVGDVFIGLVLFVPAVVSLICIDKVINISGVAVSDVRLLFAFVFAGFFLPLILPKWANATYATNNLYLRSIKSIITAVIRALTIYLLFVFFKSSVYFVGIAGLVMAIASIFIERIYHKALLPNVTVSVKDFKFEKIKILVSSGIWNTVSKCGNLLLDGLDILLANLYIDSVASGVLSLAKIIPHMINQIAGTIATTFGPKITYLYAEDNIDGVVKEVKKDLRLLSLLTNIPIGVTFSLGYRFFALWVPSQNAPELVLLSSITLLGLLVTAPSMGVINIFTMANKLKLNSIVTILFGLLSTVSTLILLKTTHLGIFAIAIVSAIAAILRVFLFVTPYAAKCIDKKPTIFIADMIIGVANVIVPTIIGLIVSRMVSGNSWVKFFFCVVVTCMITIIVDFLVFIKKEEKTDIKTMIMNKIMKSKKA